MRPMRSGLTILCVLGIGFIQLEAPTPTRAQDAKPFTNPHGDFDAECSLCHSPEAWVPAHVGDDFDHADFGFPLVGAHHETPCVSCHASLDFSQEYSVCVECHQDVHEGELGSDCETCHTTRSFIDRSQMEKAHQTTRFPLNGVHVTLDCMTCHTSEGPGNSTFANLNTECVFCHRDAYLAAVPDHPGSGLSEDCRLCHGTATWIPARFGHLETRFPLTGSHRNLECSACHGEGEFTQVPTECVACHQDDYDGTVDPDHAAIGFGTECQSCHNTTAWRPADFDHLFPIYSGPHNKKWDSCATCHINPAVYTEFSCFGCHPHSDQAKTDAGHNEVQNYVYESQACYDCHPNGRH